MSKVEEIEAAIESLSEEEYVRLRKWFSEKDWEKWDRQIEADSEAGKLDFLFREALDEKAKVKLRDGLTNKFSGWLTATVNFER